MTQAQAEGALDGQEVRVQVLRHPQDGALHGEAARAHPPGAKVQVQGGNSVGKILGPKNTFKFVIFIFRTSPYRYFLSQFKKSR